MVSKIFVDEAAVMKRMRARARGRGDRILKRSCHVTVIVSELTKWVWLWDKNKSIATIGINKTSSSCWYAANKVQAVYT